MRDAAAAAIQELCPGVPAAELLDRFHVRCTGSYIRGKATSGEGQLAV